MFDYYGLVFFCRILCILSCRSCNIFNLLLFTIVFINLHCNFKLMKNRGEVVRSVVGGSSVVGGGPVVGGS